MTFLKNVQFVMKNSKIQLLHNVVISFAKNVRLIIIEHLKNVMNVKRKPMELLTVRYKSFKNRKKKNLQEKKKGDCKMKRKNKFKKYLRVLLI